MYDQHIDRMVARVHRGKRDTEILDLTYSSTVASDEYIPFLLTVESHGLPFPCLTHSERSPSFIIFPAYEVFHNKDSGIVVPDNAFAIRNNN